MLAVLLFNLLVAVPVADPFTTGLIGAIEKLHKTDPFLDQPPRQYAVAGELRL